MRYVDELKDEYRAISIDFNAKIGDLEFDVVMRTKNGDLIVIDIEPYIGEREIEEFHEKLQNLEVKPEVKMKGIILGFCTTIYAKYLAKKYNVELKLLRKIKL